MKAKSLGLLLLAANCLYADQPRKETTESGIEIQIIREGTGDWAPQGAIVIFHCVGKTQTGVVFLDTRKGNRPASLFLGRRSTWFQGMKDIMKFAREGSFMQASVPPSLGYGSYPPADMNIGPDEPLIVEIDVLSIKKRFLHEELKTRIDGEGLESAVAYLASARGNNFKDLYETEGLFVYLAAGYLYRRGDLAVGLEVLKWNVEVHPASAGAHIQLAEAYLVSGKLALAQKHYETAAQMVDSGEAIRVLVADLGGSTAADRDFKIMERWILGSLRQAIGNELFKEQESDFAHVGDRLHRYLSNYPQLEQGKVDALVARFFQVGSTGSAEFQRKFFERYAESANIHIRKAAAKGPQRKGGS